MRIILSTILVVLVSANVAQARPQHSHRHYSAHRHFSHGHHRSDSGTTTAMGSRRSGYPSVWCGAWMADHRGVTGSLRRELWLARNWATMWGHRANGPAPGVIGVMRHHVFEVVRDLGHGRVLGISGNDGHAVRVRERSTAGVIAWRAS